MKTIDQILKIEAVVLYVLQAFKEGLSDGDRYCQSRKCSQGISGLYSREATF